MNRPGRSGSARRATRARGTARCAPTSWSARTAAITCASVLVSASSSLTDESSFRELWTMVTTLDPLGFVDLETYPNACARRRPRPVSARPSSPARRASTAHRACSPSWTSGSWAAAWGAWSARSSGGAPSWRAARTCRWSPSAPGRRPYAGGHPQPHADGQDELRRRPHQRGDGAVRDHPRRPLHGRRRGQLRDACRHLHRGAGCAALLHRAARHPADHSGGTAAGIQHG